MSATCSNIQPLQPLDCNAYAGFFVVPSPVIKGVIDDIFCETSSGGEKTAWDISIKTGNPWMPVVKISVRGLDIQMELAVGDTVAVDFGVSTITKLNNPK